MIVAVGAVAAPYLGDGTGDHSVHPTSFADVEAEYGFGIGTLNVDLRDVDFPAGVHVIDIDHGIGSARVWLPADVNYQVSGDVNVGDVDVLGETEDGFGNDVDARVDVDGTATVIIDLEVGIGYGQVRQG
jgi:predicted membrane protein